MSSFRTRKKSNVLDRIASLEPQDQKEAYKSMMLEHLGRMRTEKEIREYLHLQGCSEDMTEELVEFAKEYHFIDDLNYAECFIRESSRMKHHSIARIRYDLLLKGIDRDILDQALQEEEVSDEDALDAMVEKRLSGIEQDQITEQQITKCKNYLLSHGFSYEDVSHAIDKYLQSV